VSSSVASGILQKTLWAPEDTITATAEIDADKPAVIVDPGMLNLYETPATLTVKGSGDLTIAQAPIDNVEAWAGESAYDRVTGLAEEGELTTKATDGEEQVPDPAGRRPVAVPGHRHRFGGAGME
jgi:hypothetical protein